MLHSWMQKTKYSCIISTTLKLNMKITVTFYRLIATYNIQRNYNKKMMICFQVKEHSEYIDYIQLFAFWIPYVKSSFVIYGHI